MKVAIARTGNEASQHFGYCDNFIIYDIEENTVVKETILPNPGHEPGFLPKYLKDNGVDVIIAGGMGGKAINLFSSFNIETITGLTGTVEGILQSYLDNTLVGTNKSCGHED